MILDLITNIGSTSHAERIAELSQQADEVVFVSPFLFADFGPWIDSLDLKGLRRFTLITTLVPKGSDQLKKPAALLSLYYGLTERWPNLELIIQIDNNLHGKVYLFKKGGAITDGIITSANLTRSGLNLSHEWGVHTKDTQLLTNLHAEINAAVEHPVIPVDLLRKLALFADQYKRDHPDEPEQKDIDASLLKALESAPKSKDLEKEIVWDNVRHVFLKPWGTKDHPVIKAEQRLFGDQQGVLEFPKGKPKDVGTEDLVVTFGTGCRCILSVYQVLSYPEERSEELQKNDENARRWPWFVYGHNYTTLFGNSWWEHDITVDVLRDEFLAAYPGKAITEAGGDGLGAFQFGAGRLRVTKEFGRFVVEKAVAKENELAMEKK
jgi:hypothetical protein